MINSGSAPKHQAKYQEHESQNYLALREKWLKHALASRRLSSRGKLVASAMFFYFNQQQFLKDGSLWAWPSLRLLDKATGLDRKTVVRAIEDLEAAGYIKARREYDRERRRHKGNLYLALIPTKAAAEPAEVHDFHQGGGDGSTRVVETGGPYSMNYSMNKNIPPSLRSGGKEEFEEEGTLSPDSSPNAPSNSLEGVPQRVRTAGPDNGGSARSVAIKRGSIEMRALLASGAGEKYAPDGGWLPAVVPADEWAVIWAAFEGSGARNDRC